MAVHQTGQARNAIEFKCAHLPVVAVVLKTTDVAAIAAALVERAKDSPDFFDNPPVLLDLTVVRNHSGAFDFAPLLQTLRTHRMQPVSVRGGNQTQMKAAHAAGLVDSALPPLQSLHTMVYETEKIAVVHEENPAVPPMNPPLVWEKTLRSGQQVYARDADLVVLGAVNAGADVVADGNIHVYGPLCGRAIAGAQGAVTARIFSTCMQAQLLSIAGLYRTAETPLPKNVLGQCAQARLNGSTLLIEPI